MAAGGSDTQFSKLVIEIVNSRQFRNRLGRDDALKEAVKTASAATNTQKAGAR
jgi:hypothetical protein